MITNIFNVTPVSFSQHLHQQSYSQHGLSSSKLSYLA